MATTQDTIQIQLDLINNASAQILQLQAQIQALQGQVASFNNTNAAAATGLNNVAHASTGVQRELIVLGHEILQGNWTRFGGSLMVLAERMQNLALLFNPITLGVLAVGTAVVLTNMHNEELARSLNGIQAALAGTGRSFVLTREESVSLANSMAQISGITTATALEMEASFAHVPQVTRASFESLMRLSVDLAAVLGKTAPEAAKILGEALANPEEGAKKLDKQLNFLTASQLETISQMVRLGETAKAQEIILNALGQSINGVAANSLTPFQQATEHLGNAWQSLTGGLKESDGTWKLVRSSVDGLAGALEGLDKVVTRVDKGGASWTQIFNALLGRQQYVQQPSGNGSRTVSGTIGGGPSSTDQLAEAQRQHEEEVKRNQDQIKAILTQNAGYKARAQQIDEMKDRLTALNKVLANPMATDADKSQARKEIEGINEAMAKNKGLLDQIVAQKERNADMDRTLNGYTEKMTASEKVLMDLKEGKYAQFSVAEQAELKRLAERGVALDAETRKLEQQRKVMMDLAALQEKSFESTTKKTKSQIELIDEQIAKAMAGSQDEQAKQFAAITREQLIADARKANAEDYRRVNLELEKAYQSEDDHLIQQIVTLGMTTRELQKYNAEQKLREAYIARILQLSPGLIDHEERVQELVRRQDEALQQLNDEYSELTKAQEDWKIGTMKALNEFKENAQNVSQTMYDFTKKSFGSISDFFYNAMETGKFGFKDLANSFKQTLDRMVADALAAKLFSALFSAPSGGGSSLGASLFGAIGGMFRASGGPVEAGQPYIVGEKRAELFVPRTSGTILPDTSALSMSGGNTVQLSITAMDSQDVIRALDKIKRPLADMVNSTGRAYNMK